MYSDAKLILLLKKFGERIGRTPSAHAVGADPDMPNPITYVNHFGSFNNALKLAGFEPNLIRKTYTDEELIQSLKNFYERTGKVPNTNSILSDPDVPRIQAFVNHFGSFKNALESAGFKAREKLSDEELIQLLKDFGKKTGKTPTVELVNADPDMPSVGSYCSRFRGFNKALELAGFEIQKKILTDEELIEYLRDFGERMGRTPTQKMVCSDPEMPSLSAYRNHFGNFNKALELAGFTLNSGRRTSKEAIELLKEFGEKIGRTPTVDMVNANPDLPSVPTFMKYFGSFNNALRVAGFRLNRRDNKESIEGDG